MEDIRIDGLTADEWESLASPQQATPDQLTQLGVIQPQQSQQDQNMQEQIPQEREYEQLSVGETLKDMGVAAVSEATRFFVPKKYEWNYTGRTKAGERTKTISKWLYGIGGLLVGGEIAGVAKGVALGANAVKAAKVAGGVEKVLKGNKFFKTTKGGMKALGVAGLNIGTQGVIQSNILDLTIHDAEDGRFADMFGDTNNKFIEWLQTDEDETKSEAKLKNVVDGTLGAIVFNFGLAAASPVVKRICKNVKLFNKAKNLKEAEQTMAQVEADSIQLQKIATTEDLFENVSKIKEEALETGSDASQMIADRFHPDNIEEAQRALSLLDNGEEPFVHADGTWDIKISNYQDAYKVTPEEYARQLLETDQQNAEMRGIAREGDTAILHMDNAVRDTWVNRGWIGANEKLDKSTAGKIVKNYKDKWNIPNNVKVEFVDGLTIEGKAVEGNTRTTKNLGKSIKTKQNAIDKKKLQIKKLEDKITMAEGGNKEITDPLDNLKEELRIANNELKELQKEVKGLNKIPDITIQIDKNASNPYATFRSELEHARDIAKGEVPNQTEKHFARYNGLNEGEMASEYTYKKSAGRNQALQNQPQYQPSKQITEAELDNYKYEYSKSDINEVDEPFVTTKLLGDNGEAQATVTLRKEDGGWLIDDFENTIPHTGLGRKALAKTLYNNPHIRVVNWDAATGSSAASYRHFCEEFPDLVDRIHYFGDIDNTTTSIYNPIKRISGNGTDNLSSQGLAGSRENLLQGDLETLSQDVTPNSQQNGVIGTADNNRGRYGEDISTAQNRMDGEQLSTNSSSNQRTTEFNPNNGSSLSKPEQLKLNFNSVEEVTSGKIALNSVDELGATLERTIEVSPEISGSTFKDIARDADKYAEFLQEAESLGLHEELMQAFSSGDVKIMDSITRKVLAAQKLKSQLIDKCVELGEKATTEQKRNVIDLMQQIQQYTKQTGSASGRNLVSRKLINKGVATFGSLRLSQLTKHGIQTFTDMLTKALDDLNNLNFTRGKILTPKQAKEQIYEMLLAQTDNSVVKAVMEDSELAVKIDKVLDDIMKNKSSNDVIYKKIEGIITDAQYEQVIDTVKLSPTKEGVWKTVTNWVDNQGGLTSFYVHNLLSGVGTLAKNVISGGLNTLYFPAKKIVAGMFGGGSSLSKEGWNTYKNLQASWTESWELCKQAFLNGEGKLTNVKDTMNLSEEELFSGFREINWNDTSLQGIWHSLQNIHSLMTRAMGASDEFLSQLNYRSIVRSKALAQAEKAAELAGKAGDEQWIAEYADKLFSDAFDASGRPMDIEAFAEAKDILYQLPMNGEMFDNVTGDMVQVRGSSVVTDVGNQLTAMTAKYPIMKIMFPFVKTGANILQMNLEHNALYALTSPTQRNLLLSKTKEGAIARSQVAFGMFSFALATTWAINGGITGSAPTDPKERKALFETGWKPYSVKVGDKYYSYQGYEPLHTILGFAADSVNIGTNIANNEDEDKWQQLTQQVMALAVNNFIDKAAFRTGLRQMSLLTDPDNFVDFQTALTQTAQGFLPDSAFVKNTSSLGKRAVTQPKSLYERLFNNYFNRGLGDYRRDVFGNRQDNYGLLITNAAQNNSDSPEYSEMERLAQYGFNPSEISKTLTNTTLKYTEFKDMNTGRSAYDMMQEELSSVTINGKTLQEAVRDLVTSDEYALLPDGVNINGEKYKTSDETKLNAIRDVFIEYNEKALNTVLENYDEDFVDKKGRTMSEAVSEIQENKLMKLNNLY